MDWQPRTGKTKRGRQRRRWRDDIRVYAGITWTRTARNGNEWHLHEDGYVLHLDEHSLMMIIIINDSLIILQIFMTFLSLYPFVPLLYLFSLFGYPQACSLCSHILIAYSLYVLFAWIQINK